jgi:hypothetical protein
MSGPFGSSQWMYNPSAGFYGTEIDNSLRFNDNDSAYLSRTPASSGNQQIWTWSSWVKRANITLGSTNHQTLFSCATTNTQIRFHSSDDTLDVLFGGSASGHLRTSQVFRDVSAWFHVVVAVDTTQATASNRTKVYINGEQVTAFRTSTYPSQNYNTGINTTQTHNIARSAFDSNRWLDGYLAEINHIDGSALDPTSFGETKSGVWIPKEYSGSYGTNGFHLEFAGNANDTSGNGNNFTANNISSYDYMSDSPTNNFPTLSPIDKSSGPTLYDGNLRYSYNSRPASKTVRATMALPSSGKFYWELENEQSTAGRIQFGLVKFESASSSYDSNMYSDANYVSYQYSGGLYFEGTSLGNVGVTYYAGERGAIAVDCDTGKVWFGKVSSGGTTTWWDSSAGSTGDPASGANPVGTLTDPTQWMPVVGWHEGGFGSEFFAANINFGQKDFLGTPPANFETLSSANLPDPAIDPAADDTPEDYFDTVLYTAATSNGTYTHGDLAFRPDFTWIKNRNNVEEHYLIDVVRGNTSVTNKFLNTNSTDAEGAAGVSGTTFSVTDTGYEFVESSINTGELYFNGRTYVGWNWKAGGTGVSNTDGSITSTVSANPDAGFSVVTYTGNSTNDATIGHGLGVAPKVVIVKNRVASTYWYVYHDSLPPNAATYNLYLNTTDSQQADNVLRSTNSTTFTVSSSSSANGSSMVAYCFAEKEGYSKFGSYTGNGSSDGPFIYTGFRPAWVIVKRYDGTGSWNIADAARSPYNEVDEQLQANLTNAESTIFDMDFTSNGIKVRTTDSARNASGGSYIYMAFAENPFKYANAR